MSKNDPAERTVRDIRRKTRKQYRAEEKIRIVVSGLRGEESIAALCRREGIAEGLYYSWSKEFLEAGKKRLAGDTGAAVDQPAYRTDPGGQAAGDAMPRHASASFLWRWLTPPAASRARSASNRYGGNFWGFERCWMQFKELDPSTPQAG